MRDDEAWRNENTRLAQEANEALQGGDEMRSTVLWEGFLRQESMRLAEKEARMRMTAVREHTDG